MDVGISLKGEHASGQFIQLPPPPVQEPDLMEVFRRIWRRKALLGGTVILVMALTAVILPQLTPVYTAEGAILVEQEGDTVVKLSTLGKEEVPADKIGVVESEAEVLHSRDLAWRVINHLNLGLEERLGPLDILNKIFATTPPRGPMPLVHFTFDESSGTVAADSSGNEKHGGYVGTPAHDEGKVRDAVGFNDNKDHVDLGYPIKSPDGNDYTYAFWFKADAAGSDGQGLVGSINNPRVVWMANRTVRFEHAYADEKWAGGVASPALNTGQWYHVAGVASNVSSTKPTVKLYIDGSEVATHTFTKPLRFAANIPHYVNNRDNLHLFRGMVDDLRIYAKALTADEVQLLAKEPDPKKTTQIDEFLDRVTVAQKGSSWVIAVAFTGENPELSAHVVNTLLELYVVDQVSAKHKTISRANEWLQETVASLQEKVQDSEKTVQDFREETGILEAGNATFADQQLAELDKELIQIKTERVAAEVRLRRARELIKSEPGVNFAADVLKSPLLDRLRAQKMLSERKLAELERKYQIGHPDMPVFRARINDLKNSLKKEVQTIIKVFEDDLAIARARENTINNKIVEAKKTVAETHGQLLELRKLEREAEANRSLLALFLSRLAETSSHVDFDSVKPDARIISHASAPIKPSFPNYKVIFSLSFAGSLFLGFLLAFVTEQLDPGFRSGEQLERYTDMPVLALIPLMPPVSNGGIFSKQPSSMFVESMRSLCATLLFTKGNPPKSVLIVSSEPHEGKTTIAVSLATIQALAGRKVAIIDTDFRRPKLHATFGLPKAPGVAEFLSGEVALDDVCQQDEATRVTVVTAGSATLNDGAGFLVSDRLKQLLETFAQRYDFIVVDSPPLMAVSDARVISTQVDSAVFVVRWAKTRREVVALAIKQLKSSGGHVAGAVLSMVDPKKHAQYGFGDSAYYSRAVKKYYASS